MSQQFGLLFASPSFLEGFGRILDIGATMTEYNAAITPAQADFLALRADWRAVAQDMADAMKTVASDEGVE